VTIQNASETLTEICKVDDVQDLEAKIAAARAKLAEAKRRALQEKRAKLSAELAAVQSELHDLGN
jgi:hypothetical protein